MEEADNAAAEEGSGNAAGRRRGASVREAEREEVDREEENKARRDLDNSLERAEGDVKGVEEVGNGARDCRDCISESCCRVNGTYAPTLTSKSTVAPAATLTQADAATFSEACISCARRNG